jgi:hypothetical protein
MTLLCASPDGRGAGAQRGDKLRQRAGDLLGLDSRFGGHLLAVGGLGDRYMDHRPTAPCRRPR